MPQYTFDPATQQYRMMTPAEQAQKQQQGRTGLGGLYDAGGGASTGMTGMTSPASMSPETAVGMQNFGFTMQGIPSIAAQVAGAVAQGIPSAFGYGTVSPVANPSPIITAPIAPNPTQTLAAMNAASDGGSDEGDEGPEGTVSIGALSTEAIGEAANAAAAAAAGDAAAAAGDAGGGGDGGGGDGGGGDGSSGGGGTDTGAADGGWRRGGQIMNYAEGGIASLANKVEGEGRRGDSMLVHMSPDEVKGLQYLAMRHGGSLTINPKTGLVEANFLKSILPMVAGAALAATGVGAPMAALMVGGGATLMTGSLEQGLMAGLGAFGGAGLGAGLSAAGATAPAVTGTTQGLAAQGAAGATAGTQAAANMLGVPGAAAGAGSQAAMLAQQNAALGLNQAQSLANIGSSAGYAANAAVPSVASQSANLMGSGIKALGTEPGRAAFMQSVGGPMGLARTVGGPLAAGMFSAEEPDEGGKKPQEYIRPYGFDYKPSAEADPNFKFRTGVPGESTAEQRYFTPTFTPMGVFKAGTEPGPSFYGTPTAEQYALYSGPRQGDITDIIPEGQLGSGFQKFAPQLNQFTQSRIDTITGPSSQGRFAAGGGIMGLKKGRFLDDATDRTGESDGMSDDLPAVINGTQPARLTDGEFVVPADVVSHLGNGSSKAGAKRLHVMMDRIRKARTGTKKQAPAVKAERFMPA